MATDTSNAFPSDASRAADVPPTSTFGTATASTVGAATATSTTTEPTGTFTDPDPATSARGNPSPPNMNPSPKIRPARGGVRRLINSVLRIVDLQYRIWLTQAKLTLQKMVLYAVLFMAAALLGLLAIIFLYIGLFRVLTDVIGLRPVWAYLIFGGLHLALAVGLVMVGTSILGKKDEDDDDKKDDKKASEQKK